MDNAEQFFSTQLAAVDFLKRSGYRISKSGFNNDYKAGLVSCTSDKRFSASELLAYAERKLAAPVPSDQRTPKETQPKENEVTSDGIRVFRRQIHAVNFLHESGYKISQSKFNKDFNEGRIPCTTDKRFLATELLAYAERELSAPSLAKSASDVGPREAELSIELRGLCLGIMADGKIVQSEAEFLADWLERQINPAVTKYGILQLSRRVRAMLEDDDFSSREAKELSDILHRLVLPAQATSAKQERTPGEAKKRHLLRDPYHDAGAGSLELLSARNDIFDDVKQVDFSLHFCLTGIFAMGDRNACEHQTEQAGGTILDFPVKNDCYLVVGSIASPEWKYGNYGTKIKRALQYRRMGGSIRIISEEVWAESLVR